MPRNMGKTRMDIQSSTDRTTAREIQRHLFIGSLHREMDRMEARASTRNASLAAAAEGYLRDGCSRDEAVELLILDGFPADLARNQVGTLLTREASAQPEEERGTDWDFYFEDSLGRRCRGSQFGLTVTANSKEEAMEKAAQLVASGDDSKEKVVDAEPVDTP